ncbi:MAG: gliding motility-associated C-terminal domain-containing protein [Saprospiraceae bacterium]|nr:gliding motility-associated C-terminal domain-containing protein [Saprospiraceae bacterium]
MFAGRLCLLGRSGIDQWNEMDLKRRYNIIEMSVRLTRYLLFTFCVFSIPDVKAQQAFGNFEKIYAMPNACGITVNAGPDITICSGKGKQLNAMVNGTTNYSWEPFDGLSNPNVLNPIANPSSTTTYTLTAKATSANLISNGGFETGNLAPSTSQYTPYTNVNNLITSTGGYMIMSVPQIAQAFGCTPSIGAFTMVITPTGSGTNIWCQTINVNPNTEYKIDYKVFGILYIFGSPPTIGLKINGNLIGTVDAISGLCLEATGNFTWNSGAATSANICFANYGGQGPASMCSIDDIVVRECCEEKDELTVTVYELLADITLPDEINCLNRPISLDASGSTQGPGITYKWSTNNGKIVSGDNTLNPVVDSPGVYTLKIMGEFGCETEAMIEVKGSVKPPDVFTKNTDIDCLNDVARIEATSKSIGPNFEWNGPNGYFSTKAINLNIKEPGEYFVKVTDTYGCENTAKVEVKDNRTIIEAEIIGDSLTCSKDSIFLEANSIAKKPDYDWTGPSGFTKDSSSKVIVRDTGWYYLTTKDSFGCKELDSFYVKSSVSNLTLQLSADTITCSINSIQINLVTDTSATVLWSGPNNYTSSSRKPSVTDGGWYYVDVITKDSCKATDSIFVVKNSDVPDIQISGNDTINCSQKTIDLNGQTTTVGSSFEWITPMGTIPNQNMIQVNIPGTYQFKVKGSNGCEVSKNLTVSIDTMAPFVQLFPDTLNCLKDSLVLMSLNLNAQMFSWSGPNAFTSNLPNPTTHQPGSYTLMVTALNGCTSSAISQIVEDKIKPQLQVSADTLNCLRTFVSPTVTDDANTKSYLWSGPNAFTSNQKNITTSTAGKYTLTTTAENGCTSSFEISIVEDLQKPFAQLSADTITCKSSATLRAQNISSNTLSLSWIGPLGFSSKDSTAAITNGGIYKILLTAENGCTYEDSIVVIQKDKIPDIQTQNDTLTCIKQKLSLNAFTQSTGVRFEWTGPNGFFSNSLSPEVIDSGLYTIKIIDSLGCENMAQLYIFQFNQKSPVQIFASNDTLSCKDSLLFLKINIPKQNGSYSWLLPGGNQISADSISIQNAGSYKLIFTNKFGCISEDSIAILDTRKLPDFTLMADTLNCLKKNLSLILNTNDNDLEFDWTGPAQFKSLLKNPVIMIGGVYQLSVKNSSGCTLTKFVQIVQDTNKPDLSISADTLNCLRSIVPVKASSTLQGFNMIWRGPNGFNYTLPQFNTPNPGWYVCTIINPRTGCRTTDSVQIIQDTQRIHSVITSVQNANCADPTGRILIQQISGGKAPYLYSLDNGLSFFSDLATRNLTPGSYQLLVKDAIGCTFGIQTEIKKEDSVQIALPPLLQLKENEKAQLILSILTDPGKIKTIKWDPSGQLDCNDCLTPTLTANYEETIRVTVTDSNGCSAEAFITVKIKKESKVWFPNVFSPNGDNINDFFYPIDFGSGTNIESLSIYDRWGNRVFFNEKFPSNAPDHGWNGISSDGKKHLPGVYLYVVELLENGERKILTGDITLLD